MRQSKLVYTLTPSTSPHDPRTFNFAEERMNRAEAAKYIGVSVGFLEQDAIHRKHGVPMCRVGGRRYYIRTELNEWLLARRVTSVAEAQAAA